MLAALLAVILGGLCIWVGVALVGYYILAGLRAGPDRDFTRITEIEWPQSATVILTHNDHSLPLGDGESHIIFDTDGNTITKWLTAPAPWEGDEWQTGPVPDEIAGNCLLRDDKAELQRLLSSPHTHYAALDAGPEALPWHNGRLLLLDPANHRVWLFVWDN